MADAPEPANEAPAPAAKPPRSGSKLVPALVVLNSVLVAGLIGLQLLRNPAHARADVGPAAPAAAHAEGTTAKGAGAAPGPTQKLAEFVVHLRDAESDRFARVSFELEVASEDDKAKLVAFTPRIRDAFLSYLSDRTLEEMRGSEAIHRMKTALEAQLPKLVPDVRVRGLYVTDLVIQ